MREYSILIGGQAGDGIRQVGSLIAHVMSSMGYRIYFWDDYPSLIRGGHNFSIIRASERNIGANSDYVDLLIALNKTTADKHRWRLKQGGLVIYDSDALQTEGLGLPLTGIVKEAGGKPIMRNAAALGAAAKVLGIDWQVVETVMRAGVGKATDLNLKIAQTAFGKAGEPRLRVERLEGSPRPLMGGNEAIGLGAVRAGMKLYIAYPMTPSSSLLHFLAQNDEKLGIIVYHPENEIAAVITAIGGAYAGTRTMVGTSGGGFALMTEGLSLSGQNECPVVFVMGQRPGPSTGLPTYTAQSDLFFVLYAGHGEFIRLVVAPGDPDQAFSLAGFAVNAAWKYQVPSFVITDKNLAESTFTCEIAGGEVAREEAPAWDGSGQYKRYDRSRGSVSALAFPGRTGAIVKANSYEHDEYGITTEEPEETERMQEKRLAKRKLLEEEVARMEAVKVYGKKDSSTALLTWGSTKGACIEIAEDMGMRVVQPVVMDPFPVDQLRRALDGASKVIAVENNATACLARLAACHGVKADRNVLKYDGRPFTTDYLRKRLEEAAK